MKVIETADPGRAAAELLLWRRPVGREMRTLLPTGRSPLSMYARLRQHPHADLYVCHLDEYLPGSIFRDYMERELPGWVRLASPTVAGQEMVDIDMAVVGIGRNGHVAFNEPYSSPASRTRIVPLTDSTRAAASLEFGGLTSVPTHAVTVGIADIMDAREVIVLVAGAGKERAVDRLLHGPVGADCPVSFLRAHPNCTVLR